MALPAERAFLAVQRQREVLLEKGEGGLYCRVEVLRSISSALNRQVTLSRDASIAMSM